MDAASQVALVRATTERLGDELAGLTSAEWETPRACGDWTVAEVVAHLARNAEFMAASTERALEGISDPLPGYTFMPDRASGSMGIKERTIEYRRKVGDGLLGEFARACQRLMVLWEGLGPDDWQRPAFHLSGRLPISALLGWRTAEVSVHRWDVLRAVGREARLPEGSLEPLVEWIPRWFGVGFEPRQPLGRPQRHRFELAAPLSGGWDLVIHGDRLEVERAGASIPDVVYAAEPETFILTAMGRRPWSDALASGDIGVSGDRGLAEAFPGWFGFF